jgi:hypothetical protein
MLELSCSHICPSASRFRTASAQICFTLLNAVVNIQNLRHFSPPYNYRYLSSSLLLKYIVKCFGVRFHTVR